MFLVMTIERNCVDEIQHIGADRERAEVAFLTTLRSAITNWDGYTREDIEAILDQGYEQTLRGTCVFFLDTDGWTSDRDILKQLDAKAHTNGIRLAN